ncbi:hypothetical protein GCM10007859_26780 [Brevundimonas denitrificans]|uniref:Uncharacterized protein n=1 Tax=Brevundimonas denitrificans TaxID=1443434 RepID=A0ABQ6BS45_9CAUL|nr:hypothetical protein GCM10007859_26780 [Brevundimonas denitrificans]
MWATTLKLRMRSMGGVVMAAPVARRDRIANARAVTGAPRGRFATACGADYFGVRPRFGV